MRFLFTITGPWGTGAAAVVDGVAKELMRLGHAVKIIFPDSGLPSPDSKKYYGNQELYHIIKFPLQHKGFSFNSFPLIIPDPNPRNPDGLTYKDLTDDEFDAFIDLLRKHFKDVIDKFKPDVIETEHIWLMGYVLGEMGHPYLAGAHYSDQLGFRYDERMQPYAIQCAQKARYIFAISEHVKEEIESLYKVPRQNVILMHNGYDQELFQPMEVSKIKLYNKFGIDADPELPSVTFVGKISRTKGFDILLKANAIVQNKIPYTLLIFGAGEMNDVFKKPTPPEQLKNVYILGHRPPEDIAQFHNISEFSVLPSREEGFSIAALEAMGCGLPMVATRSGQLEKFVVGKIVPPGKAAPLANAMEEMLRMPSEARNELGKKSFKIALQYSWKDIVKKRMAYYRLLYLHPGLV